MSNLGAKKYACKDSPWELEEIVMECKYCKFGQGILEGCRSIKKILGPQSRQLEAANFT